MLSYSKITAMIYPRSKDSLLLNHTKFHENENQLHENAQIGDENVCWSSRLL
jgi:hypothetical protein